MPQVIRFWFDLAKNVSRVSRGNSSFLAEQLTPSIGIRTWALALKKAWENIRDQQGSL